MINDEENSDPKVQQFWQDYLATLPKSKRASKRFPQVWAFGAGAEMADDLGGLVVQGIKTATCITGSMRRGRRCCRKLAG